MTDIYSSLSNWSFYPVKTFFIIIRIFTGNVCFSLGYPLPIAVPFAWAKCTLGTIKYTVGTICLEIGYCLLDIGTACFEKEYRLHYLLHAYFLTFALQVSLWRQGYESLKYSCGWYYCCVWKCCFLSFLNWNLEYFCSIEIIWNT